MGRNCLYEWEMFQRFSLGGFKWVEETFQFSESFISSHNEVSDIGYFLEFDIWYPDKLDGLHNDSPFLNETMKTEKNDGRGSDLYDKNNYVIHIKDLKQALNHEFLLENMHRVIKLNQEVWLKI